MRIWTVAALGLAVAACATITRGTTQTVSVNTLGTQGATCTLVSSSVGSMTVVTPATITLPKGSDNVAVRCSKECFNDGTAILSSNLEGMTAGNIVFGGVIGLGVDAASGAMNKYAPEVTIPMTPIEGCGRPPPSSPRMRRGR